MAEQTKFGTKLGVIAATVGSAIGMGTVWRFPAVAQANGGAAFLLVYLICVFLLGIPVMLAEFSLGRAGGSDSVGNFKNLTPKSPWWLAGVIGLLASYLILSFYMVVAGWTLEYMFDSITGTLYDGYAAGSQESNNAFFVQQMSQNVTATWKPLIWTLIMVALNAIILIKGVAKGIEKISNVLMPVLFVLMVIFCYVSLTLPGASEGVKFFLEPDFSKINIDVIVNALGQAFFSLSLGMGVLVTYAAYYPTNINLTKTSVIVSALTFMMAVLMGLIIFPAVMSFGIETSAESFKGTSLVFVTLPEIFAGMSGTQIWSALFFLLLSVAAITSTISIAEVSVAFVHDRFHLSRTVSVIVVLLPLLVMNALCSLSLSPGSSLTLLGDTIFDLCDNLTTNIMLPASAFAICLYVGWRLPRRFIGGELSNGGALRSRWIPVFTVLIRYVAPTLIAVIMISKLFL